MHPMNTILNRQRDILRIKTGNARYFNTHACTRIGALALLTVASLSACDKQAAMETKTVHTVAMAKVNDVEIGVLQPGPAVKSNEGRSLEGRGVVDKKMLDTLIDRQLLQEEALRNKLDRSPIVVQALERAKTQILADAYLQSKFQAVGTPSKAEIDTYFQAHPELFTERKLYTMKELVLATKDVTPQLSAKLESAKSIEEVAAWMDKNHVEYERIQLSRSTADLAPEMITQLQTMRKNQLFVVKAGESSMVDSVYSVKPSPVTEAEATPQIEIYLSNTRRREIADA